MIPIALRKADIWWAMGSNRLLGASTQFASILLMALVVGGAVCIALLDNARVGQRIDQIRRQWVGQQDRLTITIPTAALWWFVISGLLFVVTGLISSDWFRWLASYTFRFPLLAWTGYAVARGYGRIVE